METDDQARNGSYGSDARASGTLYVQLKRALFHLGKGLGFFHLARRLTRDALRILCYHGFSLADESQFRPRLFMEVATFRKRLEYLSRKGFSVLSLDEALDCLDSGTLPPHSTVITIDDGFYSVYLHAAALLREFSFPATLYFATYDSPREQPVFRLAVQYMFWKTKKEHLNLHGLFDGRDEKLFLEAGAEKDRTMWEIIQHGETQRNEEQRQSLAEELGRRLGLDYHDMVTKRLLGLMNPQEIQQIAAAGIDVQLHTHRHNFPEDEAMATREIQDNRNALLPLVKNSLRHFCYPSGIWSKKHWPWLEAVGIRSATTCEPGFNYRDTPRLGLKRFLDGEHIMPIEFEAEMTGFSELLRRARNLFRSP